MYEPFAVGTRLRVVPPGIPPDGSGRIDLVMPRGAFGSGEHETTASCLEGLEELAARGALGGARVLDLGAGTGILAIAALALGAARATLVDLDPGAVAAARHACELNDVTARVTHRCGTVEVVADEAFDAALANLQGDILVRVAPALVARVRPGGWLLLSGIVWELNWDVRERFGALGCAVAGNRFLAEYSTVLLRRDVDPAGTTGGAGPPAARGPAR